MAALYGNDAFSMLVRSTKERYSSFLKKKIRFLENLFQSFTDRHIKACRSLQRKAILKIPSIIF